MIKMIGKQILLTVVDEYESASGLYIAGPVDKQNKGIAVAVADDCEFVKQGDTIVFGKGIVLTEIGGERFFTAHEDSILAIIDPD